MINTKGVGFSMNQQKTGDFLKRLRKDKGLTQEQLGERFCVSSRTVSRWETGRNMPDVGLLIELADFYAVDIREIIDGERKSETVDKEQKEMLMKIADYSQRKERMLLKKLVAIVIIGMLAWASSFSLLLCFLNSAKGAGFILIVEIISLLLYGGGMLCVKANRTADGCLHMVVGAVTAVVISNVSLLIAFFGSGKYQNYGLVGVYYALVTFLIVFTITGAAASSITKKRSR